MVSISEEMSWITQKKSGRRVSETIDFWFPCTLTKKNDYNLFRYLQFSNKVKHASSLEVIDDIGSGGRVI